MNILFEQLLHKLLKYTWCKNVFTNFMRCISTIYQNVFKLFIRIQPVSHKPENICPSITHDVGFILNNKGVKGKQTKRKQVFHTACLLSALHSHTSVIPMFIHVKT